MSSSASRPEPRPEVLAIAAYVPGRPAPAGAPRGYKLSSNESPLGPSRRAIAAFAEAAASLAFYPDGASHALKEAIAVKHGLDPSHILCGNGSDELFGLMAQAYLRPGDEAIYSEFGFLTYPIVIRAAGATPVVSPERNGAADVDAILARVTPATRMVFLANPNNPTGALLPGAEIRRLHAGLPPHVLFVLDAAYAEYVEEADYESGAAMVERYNNVVMTRTFSKAYGLAGLRLGWAYAPPHVIDALNRIRGPFNVNAPAQAAGVAALADKEHLAAALRHNARWLPWVRAELQEMGLEAAPSAGNFVLVRFRDAETARAADAFLTARGFALRGMDGYGMPDRLRLSIGDEAANRAVIGALREFTGARQP